ncbi:hypothetical protein N9Z12_04920 [Opitutaceae bacterium]|nr:hypothetical protein [Opitutaceae bacterium]
MKISKLPSLLVTLLLAGFLAHTTFAQQQYRVGDIVEDFELIDRATNQPVKLSELEGNIIFLEWFAWWCPFCRAAAAEIGPDIATYYENEDGNPNGVPVKHVAINLKSLQETDTEAFVRFYGLGLVLNDFDRALANRFESGGQPIFAIINGVKNSPSHQHWELLYKELGYGDLEFPIQTFRSRIDAVQASTDPEPEPEPEPEPMEAAAITRQPVAQTVLAGDRAELIVGATGSDLTYQWFRNGSAVAGATGARLILPDVQSGNTGNYTVNISNSEGMITSESALLALSVNGEGRLVNLSSRAFSGEGIQQLVPSFVANGPMKLLVRAVGPTLADFGVTGVLSDPQFGLTANGIVVAENDDWSAGSAADATEIRNSGATVGAFALGEGSKDAALVYTYDGGPRTAPVTDGAGGTGSTLAEVYAVPDATLNGQLANLAARGLVPSGEPLVAGFVLGGNRARTLLIRGVGPELANFGVTGALADSQISIASNGIEFVGNDDWSSDATVGAQIASIAATAGAFALTADSADAALLITLSPGAYTVQVTGKDGGSGIVLAEIYDVTDL